MKWNKNDLVENEQGVTNQYKQYRQYKCIACDDEFAVFARTFIDEEEGSVVIDFEDIMVFSNDEEIGKNDVLFPIQKVSVFGHKEY